MTSDEVSRKEEDDEGRDEPASQSGGVNADIVNLPGLQDLEGLSMGTL